MKNFLPRFCFKIASWRLAPKSLMEHATYANETSYFQKRNIFLFWEGTGFRIKAHISSFVVSVISIAYEPFGYRGIGYGYYTNVVLEDNEVVKIFEFSTKASESQRVELCRSLQERLEIAQKYLAKYLTETHISIESHPISGLRCVIIRQPYIKGRLLLKQPYGAFLTTKQSINYFELLTSALRLYEEQNYLLDVNQSNLVVKGDRVLVLDTILIGTVDVIMFPRTLKVLKKELNYIKQTTAIKEVAK